MKKQQQRTIFGLTLSKRAWNNVLVYIVLLLMVLLWFVLPQPDQPLSLDSSEQNNRPKSAETDASRIGLLPDDGSLERIVIEQQTLVKQQQSWHCQAPCSLNSATATAVAQQWLDLTMEPVSLEPSQLIAEVQLGFKGNQQARVMLYAAPELLLRLPQQNKVYRLPDVQVEQLLGR